MYFLNYLVLDGLDEEAALPLNDLDGAEDLLEEDELEDLLDLALEVDLLELLEFLPLA